MSEVAEDDAKDVNSPTQVDTVPMWSPEKGPAGPDRIFREAEDEQGIKQISIEDTAYWFSDLGGTQRMFYVTRKDNIHTRIDRLIDCW